MMEIDPELLHEEEPPPWLRSGLAYAALELLLFGPGWRDGEDVFSPYPQWVTDWDAGDRHPSWIAWWPVAWRRFRAR